MLTQTNTHACSVFPLSLSFSNTFRQGSSEKPTSPWSSLRLMSIPTQRFCLCSSARASAAAGGDDH